MDPRLRYALRLVGIVLTGIAFLVVLAVSVEFIVLRGETPPIVDEAGMEAPRSIASLENITLGGSEQPVLIRTFDSSNAVILFLHGEGITTMMLAHSFQRDLERHFIVVHWDRPGTGRLLGRGPRRNLGETLADTYELTRLLMKRFRKSGVILVAHGTGTIVGLHAISRKPELFIAYVGMGQVSADSVDRHRSQRRFVYNIAGLRSPPSTIGRMSGGEPITDADLLRHGGILYKTDKLSPILTAVLWAPEYDLFDLIGAYRTVSYSPSPEPDHLALTSEDRPLSFAVPVFFFLGRHDYKTPSVLAAEFFLQLQAENKRLVWFEYSGHFPFWEEPRKFTSELISVGRSLAGNGK